MRPTDFCHLNDLRVPVPRVFPARYATFIAWTPHGVLGSVRIDRGTECFTTLENASADRCWTRAAILASSPVAPSCDRVRKLRAWALSSHGASKPIEPLTPLSPLPLPQDHRSAFATPFLALALASVIAFPREEAAKAAVTTFS